MGSAKVKVKAQVLIINDDQVLVYRVLDEKTGTHIYRLIGGRVEFGELSEKAAIYCNIARKTKTRVCANLRLRIC